MSLFVFTIVIGILNGLDIYTPDHDTLMTHVHAGTLGWLTLAVAGTALVIFTEDRGLTSDEASTLNRLSWLLPGAVVLYVLAFFAGDRIPGDRIQRPIVGTLLFIVVVWFGYWLYKQNKTHESSSVVRLGVMLAWLSLVIGAVLGILLGVYSARGEIPGFDDATAANLADAHPGSMVIGFLILAAAAIAEWLIRSPRTLAEDRLGAAQMWMIFTAGIVFIIAFAADIEDLLGPANLLELVAAGILVTRLRHHLAPSAWKGSGVGVYGRLSVVFLVVNLAVLTYLVSQVVSGTIDFDALTESQLGLLLTLDHLMFLGVMTLAAFGSVAKAVHPDGLVTADKILLWGVGVGVSAFAIGLITVTAEIKRVATPILGTALLIGIGLYIAEMKAHTHSDAR
ncbi:MAG: hypothetical protein O3B42_04720 [Actinomycetota bacterium]|nr:hypothetical protein [Actinomycetota bacterium]